MPLPLLLLLLLLLLLQVDVARVTPGIVALAKAAVADNPR